MAVVVVVYLAHLGDTVQLTDLVLLDRQRHDNAVLDDNHGAVCFVECKSCTRKGRVCTERASALVVVERRRQS